ncbi:MULTISPECIES: flagellar protein FlaG [Virgibacillus]|uniref:Flagellar protein FlaG n=2 Tax=Virgibacillus TaxID=84406 RepID=A0A024QAR7_9BACI|nr:MULTISPECIES: flagellar protein FlaG [Virgibacillus]EQB37476.1 hypothetical protein M948_02725 [Virgibacillus sp. CM-4]MYL40228.1 flagellar protein FlaG [Virgibacillus massiliensis]GGJ60638.1 hypothetical protein GCM10007111_23450 [Virgibacillus kapii]CDQ39006.1 flagellar protein FlaG [Virgibacillus massiliensis]
MGIQLNGLHVGTHIQLGGGKDKPVGGTEQPQNDLSVNEEEIKTAVDELNNFIEPLRTDLRFEYHEKLNEYYVTVINPLTEEILKEIPPRKMLDVYAGMAEFMGLLIDNKT